MKLKYYLKSLINQSKRRLWANNSPLIRYYYKNWWAPKPNSLNEFLNKFSKREKNIFFIQVGSNDGIQHDPLSKFIKRDYWQGIMTEPQKEAFRQLSYAFQKDEVTPLNIAVYNRNCTKKLYKISFSNDRWASGISSFLKSQVIEQINNGHVRRMCEKYDISPPAKKEDYITFEEVECLTFTTIFDNQNVKKVDVLHIDTEGFDFEIIKLFDFDRFQPQLIIYEHSHLSNSDREACQLYLKEKAYTIQKFDADTVAYLN